MRLFILAALVSCYNVLARDYMPDFKTKQEQFKKMQLEIEQLLKNLAAQAQRTKQLNDEKLPAMVKMVKDYKNQSAAATDTFLENLKNDFDANMKKADEDLRKKMKDEIVPKYYNVRYSGIEKRMKDTKDGYDKAHAGLNKYLNQTRDKIKAGVARYDTERAPIKQKVDKIISGKLSPEEQANKVKKITELQEEFYKLAKQVQLNQFHEEEKQRSDGRSGIKQIRTRKVGAENYHSNSHTGGSFSAIHNHANNMRTIGMGEFIGVLNGIEFRTRHNDYRLKQPANKDKTFHRTADVKFPDVPPEVLNAGDVNAQIVEMRKWFKAYADQDYSVRDYRPYFRPLLVYLEGAWTVGSSGDKIDEPFESDRHHIDASSWLDLQEKVRLTSYHGTKSLLENLAHLPTKIIRFTEDKQPVLAQWNYRIVCHPLKDDLPLKNLELVQDPTVLMRNKYTDEQYMMSRAAKFDIEGIDINGRRTDRPMYYSYLDKIMAEIPGKDNYGAHIKATPFEAPGDVLYSADPNKPNETLNAAYYHRSFLQKDVNGFEVHRGQRGFSDRLYVAHTTQDRIAHFSYKTKVSGKEETVNTKVSYAIPVEIIMLTPLHSWNPYKVKKMAKMSDFKGTGTQKDPFTGYTERNYYLTPHTFFAEGDLIDKDPADTAKEGGLFVQTPSGVKPVRASGTRIILQNIPGVGKLRQRFPVMPVFGEGSAVWKKLNALEDALKLHVKIKNGFKYFSSGVSHSNQTSAHQHIVGIPKSDYDKLMSGAIKELIITSEKANGHEHDFTIAKSPEDPTKIYIKQCEQPASGAYYGGKYGNGKYGNYGASYNNYYYYTGDKNQVCFDCHENTLTQ